MKLNGYHLLLPEGTLDYFDLVDVKESKMCIRDRYGTTQAVFDSSMVWYTRNTEVLSKIYEKVKKRLKDQQDEVNHLIA